MGVQLSPSAHEGKGRGIIMSHAIIVCGTWDDKGGKKSSVMEELIKGFKAADVYNKVIAYNGGSHGDIQDIWLAKANVILWFPNIPNEYHKHRDIKKVFPKAILVTSKNNCDEVYSFQEIVAHALMLKSNLVLEVSKDGGLNRGMFKGQLLDPLGNIWCAPTKYFGKLGKAIAKRTDFLRKVTRKPTIQSPEAPRMLSLADEDFKFFSVVEEAARTFHRLINPAKGVRRFLGNASFRCMDGFPSVKTTDGRIYVSRRNVDKRVFGPEEFVQVGYNADKDITWYRGDHKPSVDTVVQLQLYRKLGGIRYMLHSHTYVEWNFAPSKTASFTETMVPCGGLQEVDEILKAIKKHKIRPSQRFALNLIGHGSLICVPEVEDFKWFNHTRHPVPEVLGD